MKKKIEKDINQKETFISETKPPPIILKVYNDERTSKSMKINFFIKKVYIFETVK